MGLRCSLHQGFIVLRSGGKHLVCESGAMINQIRHPQITTGAGILHYPLVKTTMQPNDGCGLEPVDRPTERPGEASPHSSRRSCFLHCMLFPQLTGAEITMDKLNFPVSSFCRHGIVWRTVRKCVLLSRAAVACQRCAVSKHTHLGHSHLNRKN